MLKKAVEPGTDAVCGSIVAGSPPSAPFHGFDDFERLIEAARKRTHDAYLVVLLGGDAGLGRGEITALGWDDVDLKKRQLCVKHSVWKGHLEAPKGGRLRYVPMTVRLAAAFHEARHLKGPFVFCGPDGAMVDEKTIGDHVDHAARAARLKYRGIHILRHTFALGDARSTGKSDSGLAGHVDLKTTQPYMHSGPAALEGAIRLLESSHPQGNIGATGTRGSAK